MNLLDIPEWLKISSVHFLAIAIAAGALIFGPTSFLDTLGVTEFVDGYRMWVGFVFLISTAILLARGGFRLFESGKKHFQQGRTLKRWRRRLHQLTPEEQKVLAGYVLADTRTQYFELEDGVIQGLAAEQIITRVASIGNVFRGFAYNIQPWAWRYLKEHSELLGETDRLSDQ